MKYYVYIEKHGEIQAQVFVNDLKEFAKNYDPQCMSFSGVVIDAENEKEAMAAYEAPNDHPETSIAWVPEPAETVNYSRVYGTKEDLELLSYMLRCSVAAMKAAKALDECNKRLAEIAHYVRVYSKKDVDKEIVYNKFKERYIEHFKKLRYRPFDPPQE